MSFSLLVAPVDHQLVDHVGLVLLLRLHVDERLVVAGAALPLVDGADDPVGLLLAERPGGARDGEEDQGEEEGMCAWGSPEVVHGGDRPEAGGVGDGQMAAAVVSPVTKAT